MTTAENANKNNLITGTRYLNVDGMLLFENMVADYIKEIRSRRSINSFSGRRNHEGSRAVHSRDTREGKAAA